MPNSISIIIASFIVMNLPLMLRGQEMNSEDTRSLMSQDSLFWAYYNACDVDAMRHLVADDLEFYHDKGGITRGSDGFLSTTRKNLCSNDNFRLKRESVPGSEKIFPMRNGDTLYGAILVGEHVFYVLEKGKQPKLDGRAKFTHLFLKTDTGWKLSRVYSYDHGPAPYVNKRREINLTAKELERCVGSYQAPNVGKCVVTRSAGLLRLAIGDKHYILHPESRQLFFHADRDLTFEFSGDKMIVREHGEVVEEAVRVK